MNRAAEAGEVLDLSRRGNNVLPAKAIRDLLLSGKVDPRGLLVIGARVTGTLNLDFIRTSTALQLDKCLFEEALSLNDTELPALSLDGSTFPALYAENLRTRYLTMEGARCLGVADLENAHVDGSLLMSGATATRLFASGLHVSRSMRANGLYARKVVLDGCDIGGELNLREAVIVSESGIALVAHNAKVGADIDLTRAFVKSGDKHAVQLFDAKASSLRMNGAVLRGTTALCADGAEFLQGVVLDDGFDARSSVDTITMIDTRIGSGLVLSGSVRGGRGQALVLHRTKVGASITITAAEIETTSGFAVLDLTDAVVSGQLVVESTKLTNHGSGYELELAGTRVGNQLYLNELELIEADVIVSLDGLTYPDPPANTDVWLKMLRDHTRFYEAQPYQQLAAVHRAAGHEHKARKVLIAQQEDLRRYGDPGNKLWHWFLGVTLGYGYRPSRAVIGLLVTFLLALCLVWTTNAYNGLTPAKDRPADSCSPVNRISLAADLAIPLVKLGGTPRCELANGPAGQWATGAGWVVQILGWSFATLSVAGFTGLVRKS
ncbi:hypothetical protein OG205_30445 [Lentzea sp. NBC_00516]|uniref:hypothetical protein n=1 Tax=Lentzea sp. NBC_00516 TaxID=2903582 RepID=UPI002E810778|nr:hypothetical protein [Lentzea sp. NBC_00516]WUD22397.1 hypothetical protein OG205_30445 [Lentzea sp. NBC_00516]